MARVGQGWLRMARGDQGLTRIVNKMMNLKFEPQLPSDDKLNFNRFCHFPGAILTYLSSSQMCRG